MSEMDYGEVMGLFTSDDDKIVELEEQLNEALKQNDKLAEVADVFGNALENFRKQFKELEQKVAKISGVDPDPRSLNDWCDLAYENSKAKGWHDNSTDDFVTKLALIHSEVSEVLEEYRNNKGYTEIYFNGEKPEGIPVEIADILIRIFDLCGKYKIDLDHAVKLKHEYNKTRPHRHGGKKI